VSRPGRGGRLLASLAVVSSVGVVAAAGVAGASSMSKGMAGMTGMSGMESQMKAASTLAASSKPVSGTTIVIKNFAFSPGSIKVHPGQKVKVVNKDSVAHTVTSTTGKFNTGDVNPGKTVTFTAPTKPGKYPYRCNIHQYMTGMLVVS